MDGIEDVWIPLVDEPIGGIVVQVEEDEPEIRALVDSPRRLLAFKTFAYIRVGLLLGQLLVEQDLDPYDGSETWVDQLMRDPAHSAQVRAEATKDPGWAAFLKESAPLLDEMHSTIMPPAPHSPLK